MEKPLGLVFKMNLNEMSPLHCVLYSINFLNKSRLPKHIEENLSNDFDACLLYSKKIIKGKLPDFLHNKFIFCEDKEILKNYLNFIKKHE